MEFEKIKYQELVTPSSGIFNVYVDYYWVVTPDDCILKHISYQCNKTAQFFDTMKYLYPEGSIIKQIPVIYIPAGNYEFTKT